MYLFFLGDNDCSSCKVKELKRKKYLHPEDDGLEIKFHQTLHTLVIGYSGNTEMIKWCCVNPQ